MFIYINIHFSLTCTQAEVHVYYIHVASNNLMPVGDMHTLEKAIYKVINHNLTNIHVYPDPFTCLLDNDNILKL